MKPKTLTFVAFWALISSAIARIRERASGFSFELSLGNRTSAWSANVTVSFVSTRRSSPPMSSTTDLMSRTLAAASVAPSASSPGAVGVHFRGWGCCDAAWGCARVVVGLGYGGGQGEGLPELQGL